MLQINPKNDINYQIFMFKNHCNSLKMGVPISQFDVNTKSIVYIQDINELMKDFSDIDEEIRIKIKKEAGL